MTNKFKNLLLQYDLVPKKYTIKKNIVIVDTEKGNFVFKKKNKNLKKLQDYLISRNFEYFPKIIYNDDRSDYSVYNYIEDIDTPKEQKALDIIHLMSLLHNKTTYYKEITDDEYKKIYEDIKNKLDYIYNYYNDLVLIAEKSIYMSPKEYLLCRNISKIYSAIMYCNNKLDYLLEITSDKKKQRVVTLHNNLETDHLLRNKIPYLISWEKSSVGIPIYDFYHFFKKHCLEFDFNELFKNYINKYPLLEEEQNLLFVLISIPERIEFDENEINTCSKIRKMLDYLYKAEILIKETQKNQKK